MEMLARQSWLDVKVWCFHWSPYSGSSVVGLKNWNFAAPQEQWRFNHDKDKKFQTCVGKYIG